MSEIPNDLGEAEKNSERPKNLAFQLKWVKGVWHKIVFLLLLLTSELKFWSLLCSIQNYNTFTELTIHLGIGIIFYPGLLSQVYTVSETEGWKLSCELGIA